MTNTIVENKNILQFFNSDIILTRHNEIFDLKKKSTNYVILLYITIRNNMKISESAYYNPKKFLKHFVRIQKRFSNIYLPLYKTPTNMCANVYSDEKNKETGKQRTGKNINEENIIKYVPYREANQHEHISIFVFNARKITTRKAELIPKFKEYVKQLINTPTRSLEIIKNYIRRKQNKKHEKSEKRERYERSKQCERREHMQKQGFRKRSEQTFQKKPQNIVFKMNFEDIHSTVNIFDCLCRFAYEAE